MSYSNSRQQALEARACVQNNGEKITPNYFHPYFKFDNGIPDSHYRKSGRKVIFLTDNNRFVKDEDFIDYKHFLLWNINPHHSRVSNRNRTSFTRNYFGSSWSQNGAGYKYIYSLYDSPETTILKDQFNDLIDLIYRETDGFKKDKTSVSKSRIKKLADEIDKKIWADYKAQETIEKAEEKK